MRNRNMRMLGVLALAAALGWSAAAGATPVTLYVDDDPSQRANFDTGSNMLVLDPSGIGAFGWEPANVAAAQAAGVPVVSAGGFFDDLLGARIAATVLNNPIVPASNPASPTKANPVKATAMFEFTALDQDYDDLSIVFIGKSPLDPTGGFYAPGNTGIEIDSADPWALVQPDAASFPDLYYLTLNVGSLTQGEPVVLEIDYRVAQTLLLVDPGPPETFELPQLWIGYMEEVPEAGVLAWIVPAMLTLAVARRRA